MVPMPTLGRACRGQGPQSRSGSPKAQALTATRRANPQLNKPTGTEPLTIPERLFYKSAMCFRTRFAMDEFVVAENVDEV
jgi:hypothetical protein